MTEKELIDRFGKEKVAKWKEEFKKATIQNDFIFCKVAGKTEICTELLRRILGYVIKIKTIISQSTIDNFPKSKGVRLDLLVEDVHGNYCDVEMQVVLSDSIPKRMRMYQASIDVRTVVRGGRYKNITKTIIIFICMVDPIGKGLPVYNFKNLCVEDPKIELGDDTLKIIVAPQNWEKAEDAELRALLKYLWDGTTSDNFTKEMDMHVADIKYDQIISNESLSYYCQMEDAEDRGWMEGIKEGEKKGKYESAHNMKSEGFPFDLIARITGLSLAEIKEL